MVSEHQELKAHLLGVLGREGDDRRGFPRRPRWRRRGARRREGSGEEVGQCSSPEAPTRGEEAIGAIELNGEGAKGGVRR
jgi:hypothetical protein